MNAEVREEGARALRKQIEAGWADVPYPGDDHIAVNPQHCEECAEAQAYFTAKHWRELLAHVELLPSTQLHLLSGAAWRFYLPAYMIRYIESARDDLFDYHLITPTTETDHYWRARTWNLTRQQCNAIAEFFEFELAAGHLADFEVDEYRAAHDFWRNPPSNTFEPPPTDTYGMPNFRSE